MNTQLYTLTLFVLSALISCKQSPLPRNSAVPQIMSGPHDDEGPADRYAYPYEPVTYNQEIEAPLPGVYYSFKMTDWDDDGLFDILALARRGMGLRFIKNVGSMEKPRFRSLQENTKLLESGWMKRDFNVIDFDRDGKTDIVYYERHDPQKSTKIKHMRLMRNIGQPDQPKWDTLNILHPDNSDFTFGGRFDFADMDGDGKQDLVIGKDNFARVLKDSPFEKDKFSERFKGYGGFRDTTAYNPNVGTLYWAKNVTKEANRPVFNQPVEILVDNKEYRNYIGQYLTAYDINGDGLMDIISSSQKAGFKVLLNNGTKEQPQFTYNGYLQNEKGEKLFSSFALRFEPADTDGDGKDEFVTSAYFGNSDRFTVYKHIGEDYMTGWQYQDVLKIKTSKSTPVYGAGNSSVDQVDWDGDDDTDLLVGSEPCMMTVLINEGDDRNRKYAAPQTLKHIDGSFIETHSVEEGDGSHWGPLEWYSDRVSPRARDWDGDGVLDVITCSMGKRIYFFKGEMVNGELRFHKNENFRFGGKDFVVPDRQFVAVVDYNGDGWLDLICNNETPQTCLFYGDGTLNLKAPVFLKHPDGSDMIPQDHWERRTGKRTGFEVADWDQDGRKDLVVYQFHEGVFFYKGVSDTVFEKGKRLIKLYSHMAGCAVVDWDHNGTPDLLIGGDERRVLEPDRPAQVVIFYGEDTDCSPSAL